jgi:hypothetical protein
VQIYLPSEFGVDHNIHDFSQPEWDARKKHFELTKEKNPSLKVCRIYTGLFLDDSIGPWFGFDTKEGKYEAVGSPDVPISFTGLEDIGKSIAAVVALPLDGIPDELRIAGDTKSFCEIAEIMSRAGGGDIKVSQIDLDRFKKEVVETNDKDPAPYVRFLMGEAKIQNTKDAAGCNNEYVNPGVGKWRWKTLSDLARETGGKPWASYGEEE